MKNYLILMISILLFKQLLFAQEGTQEQPPNTSESSVIDLTGRTYTISARMELPQVRIFDKRLSPDFKEVTAEKSFANELKTGSENISFEPITSGKVKPIPNIEALLKKKRF
jgi:hypothetical protein